MRSKKRFQLLKEIFMVFFKIGSFTFGGGYAMILLIEREVVKIKNWVTEEEILDILTASQSMPGAIAINSATFIGYKIGGKTGAVTATIGVILPSFLMITIIAMFFSKIQDAPAVKAVFSGIKPAIVCLMSLATARMAKLFIVDRTSLILSILSVIAVVFFNIQAIFMILIGASVGLIAFVLSPDKVESVLRDEAKN